MIETTNRLSLREFEKIFNDLYNDLYNSLCLFANKYVKDLKNSEDIVHDVFKKMWIDRLHFKNSDLGKRFLYTAVKNKSIDFLRSKYAKDVTTYAAEDLEILQTEKYFIKEMVIIEASAIIDKAIDSLPPKCREVMKLSFKGYTNPEIADKLGISFETVKSYKSDAYKKLRKSLAHLRIN